jgi:hypothetical protein
MDRCEENWYASDNNLRGTPRGNRKKPNAGRQPTCRLSRAVRCRGLERNGMVRAWHGRGVASVNQTRPHCVNQMGKAHSKTLAARHGKGTAWAPHAVCEWTLKQLRSRRMFIECLTVTVRVTIHVL